MREIFREVERCYFKRTSELKKKGFNKTTNIEDKIRKRDADAGEDCCKFGV